MRKATIQGDSDQTLPHLNPLDDTSIDPRTESGENGNEVEDTEMDIHDQVENQEDLEEHLRMEELTRAKQLEDGLNQIANMSPADFFNQVETDHNLPNNEARDEWTDWLYDTLDHQEEGLGIDDEPQEADEKFTKAKETFTEANDIWYPFKNKMELVGILLIGHSRHIMSRSVYDSTRAVLLSLCHLPESILRCGGPASLFSTEKFESYNGVLRNSSSHSNKQAPAQDIAINFSNYQALRFLLSGGIIYDKEKKKASSCSPEILDLFKNNRTIQQSFGYNPDFVNPSTEFPFAKRTTSELADLPVPTSLANMFPQSSINQVAQLQLNRHEIIKKSYFVLIQSTHTSTEYVGYVQSVWKVDTQFFVHVYKMQKLPLIHSFYWMRGFCKTKELWAVNSKDIVTTLNLQHDCHHGQCKVTRTRSTTIERLETTIKTPEVLHQDDEFFILNSASLHAPEQHRRIADLPITPVSPKQWLSITQLGLSRWGVVQAPAAEARPPSPDTETPDETPAHTPAQTPERMHADM
ncbi:hypothetical protein PCANC_27576 [Puccinia coronata f. sp. avenae]|uniref:Uncharacterized protein n=1 Tax=Puccinia coronata f. sp. avenae TaxID=200324 RepID=A0A2N5RXX0_9BASI|nr:hypothetical protein PCANC_27576 [Puccinia coronata f. sp. avenae]